HPRSGPPQRLGKGCPRDEAWITVADGVGPRDELHVAPGQTRILEGASCRRQPVFHEGPAPFSPLVHASTQHRYSLVVGHRSALTARRRPIDRAPFPDQVVAALLGV